MCFGRAVQEWNSSFAIHLSIVSEYSSNEKGSICTVNSLRSVQLEKVNNRETLLLNTEYTYIANGHRYRRSPIRMGHIYYIGTAYVQCTHRTVDEILIIFYGNSVFRTP